MNRRTFFWCAPGVLIPGLLWARYSREKGHEEGSPVDAHSSEAPNNWAATSSIGNSLPDYTKRTVPSAIDTILVQPDGRVFGYGTYDEMNQEFQSYLGGTPRFERSVKAMNVHGGWALAFNTTYAYLGTRTNTSGGTYKTGVLRLTRTTDPPYFAAPFTGGVFDEGNLLELATFTEATDGSYKHLTGIAATETCLYVSDPFANLVRIYDAGTMAALGTIAVTGPKGIAVDNDGNVWVIGGGTQDVNVLRGAYIRKYDAAGTYLNVEINERAAGVQYRHIGWDAAGGRLIVSDDGARQQVRFYNKSGAFLSTFGDEGGVYAGTDSGAMQPLTRLHNPSAAGTDASGNIYVSVQDGAGADLRSYTPAGAVHWRVQSRGIVVTGATLQGSDASDVSLLATRIATDFARPPGKDWDTSHMTVNRFKYPGDLRLGSHVNLVPHTIRTLRNGIQYVTMTGQRTGYLALFKRVGGQWKPSVFLASINILDYAPQLANKPSYAGGARAWMWRDQTGTVPMPWRAEDYVQTVTDPPTGGYSSAAGLQNIQGYDFDANGDVWALSDRDAATSGLSHGHFHQVRLQGFDAHANPLYEWSHTNGAKMRRWNMPPEFSKLKRVKYDAANDRLYLTGYPSGWDGYLDDRVAGPSMARYDGFIAAYPAIPAPTWSKALPWDASEILAGGVPLHVIMTLDVVGERIILGYASGDVANGARRIYSSGRRASWNVEVWDLNGNHIGYVIPGPEVGGNMNWIDSSHGLRANYHASSGVYTLFSQDVTGGKTLVFRGKLIAP